MGHLILVRHGESRWNISNKFTGWVDVPLSEVGIHEALISAQRLKNLKIDVAFTSKLVRAQQTLLLILAEQKYTAVFLHKSPMRKHWSMHHHGKEFEKNEIPIYSSDRLNERFYGAIQGMDKDVARKKFGKEQVFIWRRSWDVKPPKAESLKDVYKRVIPYFRKNILPHLQANQNVLVSAHGNSLRALIKYIDHISDKDIPHLELELGKPIVYKFHNNLLEKENHVHSFDRPVEWTHTKHHHRGYKSAKARATTTTKRKKVTKKKRVAKRTTKKTLPKKRIVKKAPNKRTTKKKTTSKKKVTGRKRRNTQR